MNKVYKIENIDCASCASKIEDAIKKIDGIKKAELNFFTQKLTIESEEINIEDIIKKVKKAIRKVEPKCEISEA